MYKKDFSDLGDQIKATVENAFDSIDFNRLRNDIGGKAENTVKNLVKNIKGKSNRYSEKITKKNNLNDYIEKHPAGVISGIVCKFIGIPVTAIFLIAFISYVLSGISKSQFLIVDKIGIVVIAIFALSGIGLTFKGICLRNRVKRFREYVKFLNGRSYCLISEISENFNKSKKYILKDLRKMIQLKMFKEGNIDDKENYLMITSEVYNDYLKLQETIKIKKAEQTREENEDPSNKELNITIRKGKEYISELKLINNSIKEENISLKLNKLEDIISKIFNYVEKNPKKIPKVNKFINHYLPITLKLVNAYKELDDQSIQGDNIINAKKEIENVFDTINIAFLNLLDELFEEFALDISTDISVLETLFMQEGLTKDDLKNIKTK